MLFNYNLKDQYIWKRKFIYFDIVYYVEINKKVLIESDIAVYVIDHILYNIWYYNIHVIYMVPAFYSSITINCIWLTTLVM